VTLDLRIVGLLVFLLGAGVGYETASYRAKVEPVNERVAAVQYAVGVSRMDYGRLDRRLLALEAKEPFRDFQIGTLTGAVNQVGTMANGLLAAIRLLFARIAVPSPV